MRRKDYTARYYGHIESLDYRDGHGQLWLQCNNVETPRIYCADTAKLPFSRRERVLVNLGDYFDTAVNPAIVVIDEADKDRKELEGLVARLLADGHRIILEYDSEQKRQSFEESMYLKVLRAGKKLVLDGVELASEAEYWQWKRKAKGAGGICPNTKR